MFFLFLPLRRSGRREKKRLHCASAAEVQFGQGHIGGALRGSGSCSSGKATSAVLCEAVVVQFLDSGKGYHLNSGRTSVA